MPLRQVFLFLLIVGCSSCEQLSLVDSAEATPLVLESPSRPGREQSGRHARDLVESTQRIAARILALRASLAGEMAPPQQKAPPRCPAISPGNEAERTVVIRVQDARYEPKDLLSLEFRARLQSDELATLGEFYVGGASALWNLEAARLQHADASASVERVLGQLDQRRYLAVLHVTSYAKPHVFRRKGVIRPEWNAGAIGGRLIVYEDRGSEPLCEGWVTVRGDARDAPLRRATRDATVARLHGELLDKAWTTLGGTLKQLAPSLRMPPPAVRGRAADRW